MEQNLSLVDKAGELLPLHFNAAQMRLAEVVAECWDQEVPVRILVPKGRQMGISTWIEGLAVALVILATANGQAPRVALVSHLDESAEEVFRITKTFFEHLPPEFQFPLANRNAAGIVLAAGASIKIHTIKTGDALGRGGRLNFLHFTEAAQYVEAGVDGEAAFRAINGALYKDPSSCIFIESTANGRDPFFYTKIAESIAGKNDFRVVFLPWFLEPTYQLSWENYRRFMRSGASGTDPGPRFVMTEEEENLVRTVDYPVAPGTESYCYRAQLTPNQLIWRRMQIRNELGNSMHMWSKEYPSTWREAFSATDTSLFTGEDMAYYASQARPPVAQGDLKLDGGPTFATCHPIWAEHPAGIVRVWVPPDGTSNYLISADTASARGHDYSVAYVFRMGDMRVVAAIRGQFEWEVFAEALFALGLYYGKALLACEVNAQPAVVDFLFRENYPNLYYYHPTWALRPGRPKQPGFQVNAGNRKRIIAALGDAVRTRRLTNPDKTFTEEMPTFVLVERTQKYEAAHGKHDDTIMAAAIGVFLIVTLAGTPKVSGPLLPGETEADRAWELFKHFAATCATPLAGEPRRGNKW